MYDHKLYADGGVIKVNPSPYGGTWAYRIHNQDGLVKAEQGMMTPAQIHSPNGVTNNQTELLAILMGLRELPDDWVGTILSDSQCSLLRIFKQATWNNIPYWMFREFGQQRQRFQRFTEWDFVLLDGHPTKEQIKMGIGKRGHPVSIENLYCDKACNEEAKKFLKKQGRSI